MKRLNKALLLTIRTVAYQWKFLKTYYWAEEKLYELRSVYVVPTFIYKGIFHISMRLIAHGQFSKLADKAIHRIPYHIRFQLA